MTADTADLLAASDFYEGRVDADAAVAFALATNDPNERYLRGEAVPPLFTATVILPATWESQRRGGHYDRIRGSRGSVHGEQDIFYWGTVVPGAVLRWQSTTRTVKQTKGGVLSTERVLVTDTDGVPLVEHLWSNFHMGATVDADRGAEPIDHTFPEDARARPLASRTVAIARDQAFRYAGVSGDHAGHAIDDEIARQEGYPSKILQGMCTFGLCSAPVVDVGADGDPSRLRRLAGRFSAPAFPNRDMVLNFYDAGRNGDGDQMLAFEAVQDGVAVIKHGLATFASA